MKRKIGIETSKRKSVLYYNCYLWQRCFLAGGWQFRDIHFQQMLWSRYFGIAEGSIIITKKA